MLLDMQDERKTAMLRIYDHYRDLFHFAAGSGHNHQAWPGGYADHIAECLRVNRATYQALAAIRPLPFTEDSAAICLFLHDIEKLFRYGPADHPEVKVWHSWADHYDATRPVGASWQTWEEIKAEILNEWLNTYAFFLDPDEINALKYTHGEGDDHLKDRRVAGPLAAHCHHCDNTSARIWFNEGRSS